MASAPVFRGPGSFESVGSGSLNSPPTSASSSNLVADSAVPIFPLNGDASCYDGLSFGPCLANASFLHSLPLTERHIFLCFKEPQSWPAVVDAAEFDRLPRFLAAAIKARKNEMIKKTRLTICEGRDGTDSSNGDILIFPDMVRYRGLTHFDVDAFVDEVLVNYREWLPGRPERLSGMHIFVCAHTRHDVQCGISGPIIIKRFQDELSSRGCGAYVAVKPCSHVGAPKYAGNLMAYSSRVAGEFPEHWYGYVTPDNVPGVLDDLMGKGCLLLENSSYGEVVTEPEQAMQNLSGQCNELFSCCRNEVSQQIVKHSSDVDSLTIDFLSRAEGGHMLKKVVHDMRRNKRLYSSSRWWQASWWLDFWEKEDMLAALAVVGAAATVAAAFYLYRMDRRH